MNEVLLCTHNPILIKNLYGILRDEGLSVEVVDHSAFAVRMLLQGNYTAIIIDAESFGLSAEEAVRVIRNVSPDIVVICVGFGKLESDFISMDVPVDLEKFKQVIQGIRRFGAFTGLP